MRVDVGCGSGMLVSVAYEMGGAGGPNGSSRPARVFRKGWKKEHIQTTVRVSSPREALRFNIANPRPLVVGPGPSRCRSRRAPSRRRYHRRHQAGARGRANPRPATEPRAQPAGRLVRESGTSARCRRRARRRRPSAPFAAARMTRVPWTRMIHPCRPRARLLTRGVLRATCARPSSPARRTTGVRRARMSSETGEAKEQRRGTADAGVREKATSRRSPTAPKFS